MRKILKNTILLLIISQSLSAQTQTNTNFTESEIILKTSTGDIYGTLTTPVNVKEPDADRQKNIATYSDPGLSLKQGLTEALTSFIKGIK
jgi:hypothetical protein